MSIATDFKTADLSDDNPGLAHAAPIFRRYGHKARFYGEIVTVKTFEDNSKIRELVVQPGAGKVIVMDAGGSIRCAMLGDMLAQKAVDNGWQGFIINGLIRDSADINAMDIGVHALGTIPIKSVKEGLGKIQVPVRFADIDFMPGHYVYADEDGIVVSATPLL